MNEKIRQIIKKEFNCEPTLLQDFSKGWDHHVYIATTPKGAFVIRIPKQDKTKIKLQSWACTAWAKKGVPCPTPIRLKGNYLIETVIPGQDLESSNLTKKQVRDFYEKLGKYLKQMHSVKTSGYGVLIEPAKGKYKTWEGYVKRDYLGVLKKAKEAKKISTRLETKLTDLYNEHKTYLKSFKSPRLVHCDLTPDNLMVNHKKFSGIIDAADTISGDPYYDIGMMFFNNPDPSMIDALEVNYGKIDREKIRFYACYARMWLILDKKGSKSITKKLNYLLTTPLS